MRKELPSILSGNFFNIELKVATVAGLERFKNLMISEDSWFLLLYLALNKGKYFFAQLFEIVYWFDFGLCVKRYNGNSGVKSFTCWEQSLLMSFAQFSYRESLRDIEYCLESIGSKLYHCGIKRTVSRSTHAEANRDRGWRIYADYAQVLIKQALPL